MIRNSVPNVELCGHRRCRCREMMSTSEALVSLLLLLCEESDDDVIKNSAREGREGWIDSDHKKNGGGLLLKIFQVTEFLSSCSRYCPFYALHSAFPSLAHWNVCQLKILK